MSVPSWGSAKRLRPWICDGIIAEFTVLILQDVHVYAGDTEQVKGDARAGNDEEEGKEENA